MLKRFFAFGAVCLAACVLANGAFAAVAKGKAGKKNEEIVLTSEGGMEWDSNKRTFTAEKKALAVRGDTALGADKMTAFYREVPGKSNEFFRVTATGNVIITTPKQVIHADRADYEIEKSVIILKGNPVKLFAGNERMTSKVLELWQEQNMAVAKRDVVAVKDARRLESETVKAYFAKKKGSQNEIERFEAEDGVTITNGTETVKGDSGVYYVAREHAVLMGNVKITQGGNYILGEVADINMKTGVSRLQTPAETGKPKGKVTGVFLPDKKKSNKVEQKAVPETAKPAADEKENEEQNESGSNEKLLGTSDAS